MSMEVHGALGCPLDHSTFYSPERQLRSKLPEAVLQRVCLLSISKLFQRTSRGSAPISSIVNIFMPPQPSMAPPEPVGDFYAHVLRGQAVDAELTSSTKLLRGQPTVIHFYNGG